MSRVAGSAGRARTGSPVVLGLTGDIACGKSTVLRMLSDLGAATIDADAVYHELIVPDAPLWTRLRDRYGDPILDAEQNIDRRALGAMVFADPAELAWLDEVTHPPVLATIRERIASADRKIVAVDAVKLIESGFADECDRVWIVVCDAEQQMARLMARNHLSEDDARRRVSAQPPLGDKLARADAVIDNSGPIAATRAQVERAWRLLPNGARP